MWFVCRDKETSEIRRVVKLATVQKAQDISKYDLEEIAEKEVPAYRSQIVLEPTVEVQDRVDVLEDKINVIKSDLEARIKAIEKGISDDKASAENNDT